MNRPARPAGPVAPARPVGVIALRAATACAVPPDAPRPRPGETPWLPGNVAPVMDGVYRRLSLSGSSDLYSFYSTRRGIWFWNASSPARAECNMEPSLIQTLPWCGLAAPPESGYVPADAADSEGGEPC